MKKAHLIKRLFTGVIQNGSKDIFNIRKGDADQNQGRRLPNSF